MKDWQTAYLILLLVSCSWYYCCTVQYQEDVGISPGALKCAALCETKCTHTYTHIAIHLANSAEGHLEVV